MDDEPIEAQEVRYISFGHLLDWSLEELKRQLGQPYKDLSPFSNVVEADKPQNLEEQGDNVSPRELIDGDAQ